MSPCNVSFCIYIFLFLRDYGLYLFTFENRVPLMRYGASVVWHLSLSLMNSLNKNEAVIFLIHAVLPEGFPFSQLKLT